MSEHSSVKTADTVRREMTIDQVRSWVRERTARTKRILRDGDGHAANYHAGFLAALESIEWHCLWRVGLTDGQVLSEEEK